jgi:hypothetical protein
MRFILVAMLALVLSACSGKGSDRDATNKRSASAPMPAFGGDDAVAAVRESAGTPVAQLRFVIDTRPVAGKPFRVQLIATAAAPTPRLSVTVDSDTLRIDPSSVELALDESDSAGAFQYGASHDFMVVAQNEGLAEMAVHLTTDADTPETVYVIPVLVAKAGATEPARAPSSEEAVVKPDPATGGNNRQPQKG